IRIRGEYTVNNAIHCDPSQILDIDLMHNTGSWWDNLKVIKRGLTPTQELIAFLVPLVFIFHISLKSVCCSRHIDNDRMVNDQFSRSQRINLVSVSTQLCYRFAHGCKVDNTGNTGEVLHDDAGGGELNFGVWFGIRIPVPKGSNMLLGDIRPIFGAK